MDQVDNMVAPSVGGRDGDTLDAPTASGDAVPSATHASPPLTENEHDGSGSDGSDGSDAHANPVASTPPPPTSETEPVRGEAAEGGSASEANSTEEADPADGPVTLEERCQAQQNEIAALTDRVLRARAELANVQKRAQREAVSYRAYATADVLRDVLGVLDMLDMSLQAAREGVSDSQALLKGVEMTRDQLEKVLLDRGAKRIETEGCAFDPHVHEAVSAVEVPNTEANAVIQEIRRGYRLKERVLRAAQVIVAK
jgi:molecular chaperone GrpE